MSSTGLTTATARKAQSSPYSRCQKVDTHRGPAASYKNLHKPIPSPPKGMEWVLDVEKREWSLEAMPDHDVIAYAGVIDCRDEPEFFLEHLVQSTDTLAEICHSYKLTPSELRQANPDALDLSSSSTTNRFLRIPYRPNGIPAIEKNLEVKQLYPVPTPEDKVKHMCQACRDMSPTEAKCYLELNDWNLMDSLKNAQEDGFGSKKDKA